LQHGLTQTAAESLVTLKEKQAVRLIARSLLDGDVIGRNVDEVGAIAREKSANDSVIAP
jgi:hypothetical protein